MAVTLLSEHLLYFTYFMYSDLRGYSSLQDVGSSPALVTTLGHGGKDPQARFEPRSFNSCLFWKVFRRAARKWNQEWVCIELVTRETSKAEIGFVKEINLSREQRYHFCPLLTVEACHDV